MKYLSIVLLAFMALSCKNEKKVTESGDEAVSADTIIDSAISVSGGEAFGNAEIQFNFRDKSYMARRSNSTFALTRISYTDNDTIIDIVNNTGFERLVNEKPVSLKDSLAALYSDSVNSVHYFSILPYGLNDKAVTKTLLGEEQIKGKDYYKIKVTFSSDGGGEDYDDVYVYWINKETDKPDYFAYSYSEADGMGLRFRVAYNERYIEGLRFVDYENYESKDESMTVVDLGKAFENDKLNLLSKIDLEKVEVKLFQL